MIPVDKLHQTLGHTNRDLERLGSSTWQRFSDWVKDPKAARDILRGGGVGEGGQTDDQAENAMLDRQASGYQNELDRLTERMFADAERLRRLLRIANPDAPRSLRPGDLSAAQLAADGWCPNCYRDSRFLSPVAEGRYRDRCRGCGEFRATQGRDANVEELRIMHSRGKRIPQRIA